MAGIAAGDIYGIYMPANGWMLFRADNSGESLESIDGVGNSLPVYRYANEKMTTTEEYKDGNGNTKKKVNPFRIPAKDISLYRHYKVEQKQATGLSAQPDATSDDDAVADGTKMQTLANDPIAMALYECINSVLPSIKSLTQLMGSVSSANFTTQKAIVRKTEHCIQVEDAIQKITQQASELQLVKLMENPTFQALFSWLLPLLSLVLALIIAAAPILSFITAFAAAVIIYTAFALMVAAIAAYVIAASVYIAIAATSDKKTLKKLKDEVKDIDPLLDAAVDDLKDMITSLIVGMSITLVLNMLFDIISFVMPVVAGAANELTAELFFRMLLRLSSITGAAQGMVSGTEQIASSMLKLAMNPLVESISIQHARLEALEAESSYMTAMQNRLAQEIKSVWEYVEQMFKAQSELIKTMGDGYTSVVRNFAI
jgi:hypothetical protein